MSSPSHFTNYAPSLLAPDDYRPLGVASSPHLSRYSQNRVVATPFKLQCPLFAFIIGINRYENSSFQSLHGAESDALAFKNYFEKALGVPSENVSLLLGREATRSNIIRGFKRMAEDRRIRPGDAIAIFFAGHGGEVSPRNGQEAGGPGSKIQMIVPYDCSSEPGREIPTIPDHTIGALMNQICKEKGDNITVFMDCCHAASGTRSFVPTSNSRVRSVFLENGMYNPHFDQIIPVSNTRAVFPSPRYGIGGLRSHMLLAACGSKEKAFECGGRGNFSAALLRLLYSVPPDQLRYRDILSRMERIENQNPQCEGNHGSRFLFGAKVEPVNANGFSIHSDDSATSPSSQYWVNAGSIHGVAPGMQFTIPGERVRLMASVVNAFNSVLHSAPQPNASASFMLNQPTTVLQTTFGIQGRLRLYVPPNDPFRALLQGILNKSDVGLGPNDIILVEKIQNAHLGGSMHPSGRSIVLEMLDSRATQYGFHRQFDLIPADAGSIANILSQAAHFFRVLERSSTSTGAASQISIEFYQLQETSKCQETGEISFMPCGPNLCREGRIDFTVSDEGVPYGFKIINNSSYRFYAYLFYFDFSDLSIVPFYQTPAAPEKYQTDFSLRKRNGSLTIGYGSGGVSPFSFALPEDQDLDVGFLKLFVSTKPIDLDSIPQGSPFSLSKKALTTWVGKNGELWDDPLVPVVLRRRRRRR